jgi:hypothetical protein
VTQPVWPLNGSIRPVSSSCQWSRKLEQNQWLLSLCAGDQDSSGRPVEAKHRSHWDQRYRANHAEAILKRCEAMAGELGLFAEEFDARRQIFLGNTPLLFAHVEYVRAVREVAAARARANSSKE